MFHYDSSDYYQFITFRTYDSLDSYVSKLNGLDIDNRDKQYKIDCYLDSSPNGAYLNGDIIILLEEIILENSGKMYDVISFSIMPNHVHLLIKQKDELPDIMQKIKGKSSFMINKVLGKKGTFWANDYYDRSIRNEEHFFNTIKYIKENAEKAGLKDCEQRFYCKPDLFDMFLLFRKWG